MVSPTIRFHPAVFFMADQGVERAAIANRQDGKLALLRAGHDGAGSGAHERDRGLTQGNDLAERGARKAQ